MAEEEDEEEGAPDSLIDWSCGRAESVALVVTEFRIRDLESTALLWSAVLHGPCWRQQQSRLLWPD